LARINTPAAGPDAAASDRRRSRTRPPPPADHRTRDGLPFPTL